MLIVLGRIPVAAPGKAVFGKETVAQIILVNLIGKALTAVGVDFAAGRGDIVAAVLVSVKDHIGIVVWVHVDGKPIGMFGQIRGAVDDPVVKAGGIIFRHRGGIVTVILIDQTDALEPVFIPIKLIEDFRHILCNGLIADQLAILFLAIKVNILKTYIVQVFIGDSTAAFRVRNAGNSVLD